MKAILQLGDPRLREKAEPVSDFESGDLKEAIQRLKDVLKFVRTTWGFGRAIAAPQIGVGKRVVALDLGAGPLAMINPEIKHKSEETFTLWDDCLSFPALLVKVRRHASISVSFLDEQGEGKAWNDLDRGTSELLQHEIDHLDGVLAIDRALDSESIVSREVFESMPEHFKSQVD